MDGSSNEFPSLRPGAVVDVRVDRRKARPVEITLQGHAHTYELAWRPTSIGPAIIDLRITSPEGVPITSDSLRRINTERLAKTAEAYDTDQAAETGRIVGDSFKTDLADVMSNSDPADRVAGVLAYFENADDETGFSAEVASILRNSATAPDLSDLAEQFDRTWRDAGGSFVIPPAATAHLAAEIAKRTAERKRRGGRPRQYTHEFLLQVAKWATEGAVRGSVYKHVQKCAIESGEKTEFDATIPQVRWWIKRCKDAGLLPADFAREPRRPSRKA